jgi:hypothetical protein
MFAYFNNTNSNGKYITNIKMIRKPHNTSNKYVNYIYGFISFNNGMAYEDLEWIVHVCNYKYCDNKDELLMNEDLNNVGKNVNKEFTNDGKKEDGEEKELNDDK